MMDLTQKVNYLIHQIKCIKEKGCLCFAEDPHVTYDANTGVLEVKFVDGSVRTTDFPVIHSTNQLLNNGALRDVSDRNFGDGYLMQSHFSEKSDPGAFNDSSLLNVEFPSSVSEAEQKRRIQQYVAPYFLHLQAPNNVKAPDGVIESRVVERRFNLWNAVTKLSFKPDDLVLTYVDEADRATDIDLKLLHTRYTSELLNNGEGAVNGENQGEGFLEGTDVVLELVENYTLQQKNQHGIGNHDTLKVIIRTPSNPAMTEYFVKNLMYMQSLRLAVPRFRKEPDGTYTKLDDEVRDFPIYQSVTSLKKEGNELHYTDELGVRNVINMADFANLVEYTSHVPVDRGHVIGVFKFGGVPHSVRETVTKIESKSFAEVPDNLFQSYVYLGEDGEDYPFFIPQITLGSVEPEPLASHADYPDALKGRTVAKVSRQTTPKSDGATTVAPVLDEVAVQETVTKLIVEGSATKPTGFTYVNEAAEAVKVKFPTSGGGGSETVTTLEIHPSYNNFSKEKSYIYTNENNTKSNIDIPILRLMNFSEEAIVEGYNNVLDKYFYYEYGEQEEFLYISKKQLLDISQVKYNQPSVNQPLVLTFRDSLHVELMDVVGGHIIEGGNNKYEFSLREAVTHVKVKENGLGFDYVNEDNRVESVDIKVFPSKRLSYKKEPEITRDLNLLEFSVNLPVLFSINLLTREVSERLGYPNYPLMATWLEEKRETVLLTNPVNGKDIGLNFYFLGDTILIHPLINGSYTETCIPYSCTISNPRFIEIHSCVVNDNYEMADCAVHNDDGGEISYLFNSFSNNKKLLINDILHDYLSLFLPSGSARLYQNASHVPQNMLVEPVGEHAVYMHLKFLERINEQGRFFYRKQKPSSGLYIEITNKDGKLFYEKDLNKFVEQIPMYNFFYNTDGLVIFNHLTELPFDSNWNLFVQSYSPVSFKKCETVFKDFQDMFNTLPVLIKRERPHESCPSALEPKISIINLTASVRVTVQVLI